MEQVEVALGERKPYGEYEDPREIVQFRGSKILETQAPDSQHINYTLYECPGGYRVLICLDINLGFTDKGIHFTFLAPPRKTDRADYLLSKEEIEERFPFLPATAGKVLDLDEVQPIPIERRERAVRFARIMALVQVA